MESYFFMIPDVVNVDGKNYDEVTICYLVIAIRPNRFNKNQLNLATLQIILTGR
jgi:hypothetical protein